MMTGTVLTKLNTLSNSSWQIPSSMPVLKTGACQDYKCNDD